MRPQAEPAEPEALAEPSADARRLIAGIATGATVDKAAIRQLLEERRYLDLNSVLDAYQSHFKADPVANENTLVQAFKAFQQNDVMLLVSVTAWIKATPNAWQAHTARSICAMQLGWEARGKAFVKETRPEQMQLMGNYHTIAIKDAAHAIELEPDNFTAYRALVKTASGAKEAVQVLTLALERFPYSHNLRWNAMETMSPRWGGSYLLLDAVAQDAQRFVDRAPQLRELLGFPYAARARDLHDAKQLDEAYAAYSKALSFGEASDWYGARAKVARELKRYDDAAADVAKQRALHGGDVDDDVWQDFSRKLWGQGRTAEAAGDLEEALKICTALSRQRPDEIRYVECRADMHRRLRHHKEAEVAYRDLIRLKPDDSRPYWGLWTAMAALKKHRAYLALIDSFIAAHPEDPSGYSMRGTALRELGERKKARKDFDKSCSLRSSGSCAEPEKQTP